jgi:hypothetical protein
MIIRCLLPKNIKRSLSTKQYVDFMEIYLICIIKITHARGSSPCLLPFLSGSTRVLITLCEDDGCFLFKQSCIFYSLFTSKAFNNTERHVYINGGFTVSKHLSVDGDKIPSFFQVNLCYNLVFYHFFAL